VKIIVNGQEIHTTKADLSYRELVEFSGQPYSDYYSIAYSLPWREDYRRSGTVTFEEVVDLDEGMVFTVVMTGSA
jgi:hypothetical protein